MSTDTTVLEVVAFEDMKRPEMIKHLADHHQTDIRRWGTGSKTTKDQMTRWHNRQHAAHDELVRLLGTEILTENGLVDHDKASRAFVDLDFTVRSEYLKLNGNGYPTFSVAHTHLPVGLEDELDLAHAQEVREAMKRGDNTPGASLNATQRAALKAVVDNDFNAIDNEIRDMANTTMAERRRKIEEEFAAREQEAQDFVKKMQKQYDKMNRKVKKQVEAMEIEGIRFDRPSLYSLSINYRSVSKNEQLQKATAEIEAMKKEALAASQRQRLIAHRTILLTGVSEDAAKKVLDSIPDARTMMAQQALTKQVGS